LYAAPDPVSWFADEQARNAAENISCWELVTNEGHRDALLSALHSASSSITITSGDLTRSAVDPVFVRYLADAVARGVQVRVLWGFQGDDYEQRQATIQLVKELRERIAADPARFLINSEPKPVHAKTIVVDHSVSIVSSFNFLSYRGTRSGAHEMGVKTYSSRIAGELEQVIVQVLAPGV